MPLHASEKLDQVKRLIEIIRHSQFLGLTVRVIVGVTGDADFGDRRFALALQLIPDLPDS